MSGLFLLLGLLSCSTDRSKAPVEPTFFEVSGVVEGWTEDTGSSEDDALPFSNGPRTAHVSGRTLDRNADPYPYDGWVEVTVRPGHVVSVDGSEPVVDANGRSHWYIQADAGLVETDVAIASSFGNTRIWFTAVGDISDLGAGGSYASGVTESIQIRRPTIAEMQELSTITDEDAHATNPLFGEFVTLRVEDRRVVVSSLTAKGFYAVDIDDPVGSYNALFIYTFNKPEGIDVGDRLGLLAGGSQEYIGTTQLSFPVYEAMEDEVLEPPAPAVLDPSVFCSSGDVNHMALEPYESSLVELSEVTIPEDFRESEPGTDTSEDYSDYLEYGQWPVEVGDGCILYAVSSTTAPSFDPTAHAGENLGSVRGMLAFVQAGPGKWIINVRGPEDLPNTAESEVSPSGPSLWPIPLRPVSSQTRCVHHPAGTHSP